MTKPGEALAYPIAIPRQQDVWQGTMIVSEKKVNPSWTPTPDMIKERLRLYRDCGVTTLRCGLPKERDLDTLAQLLDLVREVNEEPSVR